jgi:6,7-dimethyl-8-ribityllumazine synthase
VSRLVGSEMCIRDSANGVLTTENDEQAEVRMMQKGADCAAAAVEMANLLKTIGKS